MALHLLKGKDAEQQALRHLEQSGMQMIECNYRCKLGEIDLVMQDQETLVFVEVRYRKSTAFGSAIESVTSGKQKKLLATANHYLQHRRSSAPCRFDVVGLTGQNKVQIEWIKDAFRSD